MRGMRNVAAAVALVFAFSGAAEAQMSIGAKLGLNLSNVENAEVVDSNARTAFTGGGFLRFGFGSAISIQPEVMFSPKGADRPDEDAPGFPNKIELEYVEIPVFLRYDFQFDPFRPYLIAGPYAAFEVACELGDTGNAETGVDCDEDTSLGVERRKTDFGIIAGGGLSFGMGPGRLLLEARYGIGLQDLYDNDEAIANFPFEDIENRHASLLVGFEVGLR